METADRIPFLIERQAVADAGRRLLREGLVARTWGNVSCRTGKSAFVITPSGLGYEHMAAEDVVPFDMLTGEWTGPRRPSSEKGVHSAMYARFAEAEFVVHTHQTYGSALGLAGFDTLTLTDAEREALGGLALAAYGMPGTKTLIHNVERAISGGAHTVLMAHHGALAAGRSAEEAFERARLLEAICRRACRSLDASPDRGEAAQLLEKAREAYGESVALTDAPAVLLAANAGLAISAELDDMAQMIGDRIPAVSADKAIRAVGARNAVLVSGVGALVSGDNAGDREALCLLVEKACICALHARALGKKASLPLPEVWLMRAVYLRKYSKKIGG